MSILQILITNVVSFDPTKNKNIIDRLTTLDIFFNIIIDTYIYIYIFKTTIKYLKD